jgi:Zn-dependent protease
MAASTEDPTVPAPGMRLATVGGVPVYIGKSWPVIAVIIVAIFGPGLADDRPDLGLGAYVVALVFAVLLLISVFAHEAAHAVVATRVGYRVNRVVADLWGGHTAYDSSSARPGASALVAIAGPAANALLAVVGWLAMPAVPLGGVTSLLVGAIVYTNAFVAAFNMLPGLPLDGGFLVDSLVWRVTGSRESGLIAAGWCGRAVTVLVVLWFLGRPLLNGQPPDLFNVVWALFIGSFLWVGATNAIRAGRGSRLLAGIRIDSVWRPAASLPPQASAAQALALRASGLGGRDGPAGPAGAGGTGGTVVVVEDDGRNAIGLLDDEALLAIPDHLRAGVAVTSVMRRQPDGWVVAATPDQPITAVVGTMQTLGIGAVPVRGPDGRIVGIVLAGDLEAALSRRPAPPT